jgi:hypothetical protein
MNVKNGIIEHNNCVSPERRLRRRRRFDALTMADLIPPIELQILRQRSLGKKDATVSPFATEFFAEILPRSSSNIDDDDDDDGRELIASESVLCNLLPWKRYVIALMSRADVL